MRKRKLLVAFLLAMVILLVINKSVFASEVREIEYEPSEDIVVHTDNSFMPFITKSRKYENFIVTQINRVIEKVGATFESAYRTTGLKVKHQGTTGECWAFAYTSAFEALNLKRTGSTDIYSPRHLDYSCSKSVVGAPSLENLFNRETTEEGGNYFIATAYAASGKGPVLESDMPFKDDVTSKVSYSSLISKKAQKQLDETIFIDSIYKKNSAGNITCYSDATYLYPLTSAEVADIRSVIKSQIKNSGGVASCVYEAGNSPNICETDSSNKTNHAIFVVGWDDNYQAEGWKNKGAYIALNSYGEDLFDNGYIYISYDDIWIESAMTAVSKTSEVDFDSVYEYDPFGATSEVYSEMLTDGTITNDSDEISAINIFNRDSSKTEMLKEIGVSLFSYEKAEVYVTQEFDSEKGLPLNFTKVASMTDTLSPGFVTIQFDKPVILKRDKFAVCVRFVQDNQEGIATVAIESRQKGSAWWDNVNGKQGETYFVAKFREDGQNMYWGLTASDSNGEYYRNACIKAYTSDYVMPELSVTSSEYTVNDLDRIITRVPSSTDISVFKSKVNVNLDYKIVDRNGNEITNGIMKTAYKLKVDDVEYSMAVIGDLSGDGLVNTLDLARMRFHMSDKPGYILQGIFLQAADLSGNGTVNVVDLAQIRRSM